MSSPLNCRQKHMTELEQAPSVNLPKGGISQETSDLAGLLKLMNNPELELIAGTNALPEAEPQAVSAPPPPLIEPPAPVVKRPVGRSLLISGRLAAGKDYVAQTAEATIFGFAEPLYALGSYFFGVEVTSTKNKDLPGMRKFLQFVGQWGRNIVNDEYPYTPSRAVFSQMIRSLGTHMVGNGFPDFDVDWKNFGLDSDLWIKAAASRINKFRETEGTKRVAITNARFENELKYFREAGWDHWHVMVGPQTWEERLAQKKLTPQSKELNDVSERLAMHLDNDAIKKISAKKVGPKLRVIWNDHRPSPSARFYTLNEFLQEVAIAETPYE